MSDEPALQILTLQKLTTLLGAAEALALFQRVLIECGLRSVESPNDLQRFANSLLKQKGVIAAVGRALKIQAILLGATE